MSISVQSRFGPLPHGHVADLLTPGLRVVFCGTALGRVSAARGAYYANPRNKFWATLFAAGLIPAPMRPEDWPGLAAHGIGLTDVCKAHYGNDNELPVDAFDPAALRAKIARYQPGTLAFTSKKAAAAALGLRGTGQMSYGLQPERWGATRLFTLPSPSGSASAYWDAAHWHDLAAMLAQPDAA